MIIEHRRQRVGHIPVLYDFACFIGHSDKKVITALKTYFSNHCPIDVVFTERSVNYCKDDNDQLIRVHTWQNIYPDDDCLEEVEIHELCMVRRCLDVDEANDLWGMFDDFWENVSDAGCIGKYVLADCMVNQKTETLGTHSTAIEPIVRLYVDWEYRKE